jgi:hypothetical protein
MKRNTEFWTVRSEDTMTVNVRVTIQSSITVTNMPRVNEKLLQDTLIAYMDRGMDAFDKAQ